MQRRKPPFLWTREDSEEMGLKLSLDGQRAFQERKSQVGRGAAGRRTSVCDAPEHKSWLMTVLSSSKRQWSLSPDAATEIPVSFAQGLPKLPTSQRLICPLLWEGLGSSVATVAARWHHYNLSTLAGRLSNVWKSHTDPYMLPQG